MKKNFFLILILINPFALKYYRMWYNIKSMFHNCVNLDISYEKSLINGNQSPLNALFL